MGRLVKVGIDYFPLDVHIKDKIELFEAECGLEGYAILIKLWQKIYSVGYYIDWDEDVLLLFSRKINSSVNTINSVVNTLLRRGIFNKLQYKNYKILTSRGIQNRYFKICNDAKRIKIKAEEDYLLLTPEEIGVYSGINLINSGRKYTKKRREEKNKEDNICEEIFNHYLSLDLIKHRTLNKDMEKAIRKAVEMYGDEVELLKKMATRHCEKVKLTNSRGIYAVKLRPLTELYGQKKKDSTALICSDYTDGTWERWKLIYEKNKEDELAF